MATLLPHSCLKCLSQRDWSCSEICVCGLSDAVRIRTQCLRYCSQRRYPLCRLGDRPKFEGLYRKRETFKG
ncbi:hypothetical protein TNCV_2172161 [Trichonephila clavipes]|nr:hypothetical protein TNCV_2172161 [Trichonephila clavipes]